MHEATQSDYEPTSWLVVFHTSTGKPWLDRLIPGRFKHANALYWDEISQVWVFYDPAILRTKLYVIPGLSGRAWADKLMDGQTVLCVPVNGEGPRLPRFGFWCSTSLAHLLGIRGGALPQLLYNACLASGAIEVATGQPDEIRRTRTAGAHQRGA